MNESILICEEGLFKIKDGVLYKWTIFGSWIVYSVIPDSLKKYLPSV